MKQFLRSFKFYSFHAWIVPAVIGWLWVTAVHSVGPFHPDEYYQVIEFASHALGITDGSKLPWEFAAGIRPWFQPYITAIPMSIGQLLDLSPSTTYTLIRFYFGLLMLAGVLFFTHHGQAFFSRDFLKRSRNLFFFVYVIPFLAVRSSSESFSFTCLLFALGFASRLEQRGRQSDAFLTALLFGFSILARAQSLAFFGSYFLWKLFLGKKLRLPIFGQLALGFICSMLVGILLDRLGYGYWTISLYNYFDHNLLKGVAASFGVEPWYFFVTTYLDTRFLKPWSVLLLLATIVFLIRNPKHLFTFLYLGFFILNSAIGHKEHRFIIPLILMSPFFITECLGLLQRLLQRRTFLALVTFLVLANTPFLIRRSTEIVRDQFFVMSIVDKNPDKHFCLQWDQGELYTYTKLPTTYMQSTQSPPVTVAVACETFGPKIIFDPQLSQRWDQPCKLLYQEPWWLNVIHFLPLGRATIIHIDQFFYDFKKGLRYWQCET